MQFTESWLKSLVNTPLNTQELGDKLTMAGLEVEELEPLAPEFSGVVVGLVVVMQSPALLSSAGIFSPVSLSVSLSPMLFKSL